MQRIGPSEENSHCSTLEKRLRNSADHNSQLSQIQNRHQMRNLLPRLLSGQVELKMEAS